MARKKTIKPPEHLSEKSKDLWERYVGNEINAPARIALFLGGLEALDQADEARVLIKEQGLVHVTEKTGAVHINPLTKLEKEARAYVLRVFKTLNLTWER